MGNNVEAEDKGVVKMTALGGRQSVTVINESGQYSSIIGLKRTD